MNIWLIAKSNMKKKKSNVIVLFILIMIVTMLLYSSVTINKNVSSFIDEKNESVNGTHIELMTSKGFDKEVSDIIKSEKHYEDCLKTDAIVSISEAKVYNKDADDDKESMSVCFNAYDPGHRNKICDYKIIDKGKKWENDSIILPYYMKVVKGYEMGQKFEVTIDGQKEKFIIYGFFEDIMMSTPSSMAMYELFVDNARFDSIKDLKGISILDRYRIRLDNMKYSDDAVSYISDEMTKKISSDQFVVNLNVSYNNMKKGSSMFIGILMTILAIFSILIMAIVVIVIRFSINMNLESNLPNIGILESVGYTSSMLRLASVMEYMFIAVSGIIVGLIAAFGASRKIALIVSQSIGINWENKIDVTVIMITVIVVTAMVLIITAITSSKIKKITPLDALRNGIQTHNFTKNHLPLLNSRLDLNSSLGIKNIFRQKKQNIAIAFIVALIVFSGEMMLSLYHNFVYDQDSLINLVGLEKPDILIKSKQSDINEGVDFDKMCDELVKEDNISRAITCRASNMIVKSKDNKMTISAEIYNEPEKVRINTLVSGRHVKHSNEINISSVVAERLGVNKGDTVMIESNKKEEAYVISGITQRISNLGISLIMSEEGAKRINCTAKPDSLYVYLNDASDIKGEIKQIKASYNNTSDIVYSDFDEIYQSVLSSFTGSLKSLCIIFVIVTIIVIALIILLVMKMKMVREKRNMGIYKAIGFTTIQIIWQNVMSFAPVISVGALAGVLIGKLGINKACVAALSLCGIVKANLTVPFLLVASIFVITTILSFIICILASLKVRKIEAYKMITEQ